MLNNRGYKMRILVTFAVEAEFAPWRAIRKFQELPHADMECFSSKIRECELAVLLTGMGCKKARLEATKAIWNSDVDICVSSGLAGALRPEHGIGEILVPQQVLAAKLDRVISCDLTLVESAVSSGAKRVSTFYTADRVIIRAEEKKSLGAAGDAVEMESGDILFEAAALGARVVAARAISDAWDQDLPIDFNSVATEEGDVSISRILGKVAGSPGSVPSLIRFGQQSKRAAQAMAEFLERFIPRIATASQDLSPQGVAQ
jgi:adenosylhomocysteine nucleosidase